VNPTSTVARWLTSSQATARESEGACADLTALWAGWFYQESLASLGEEFGEQLAVAIGVI
jgi:hypothetical protein